jgi:hypothetical protein
MFSLLLSKSNHFHIIHIVSFELELTSYKYILYTGLVQVALASYRAT